jgi:hypothetical protein
MDFRFACLCALAPWRAVFGFFKARISDSRFQIPEAAMRTAAERPLGATQNSDFRFQVPNCRSRDENDCVARVLAA